MPREDLESLSGAWRQTAADLRGAAESGDPQAGVEYARRLLAEGDVDGALPWLEAAALEGDAFAARTLAVTMRDRGAYERAERWYRAAADEDGECAFGLARLLEKAGMLAEASQWYEKGAALGDLHATTNGALLLARRGMREEAAELLLEARRRGDAVAGHALDRIEELQDDLRDRARRVDEAAGTRDPYEALDVIHDLDEDTAVFRDYPWLLDGALALYDQAAQITGNDQPLVWKALLLDKLELWDEARRLLESVAERFPTRSAAPYVLGVLHRERGHLDEAERWLRVGAGLNDPGSQWNLAALMLRQRRLDEAERWFASYRERPGDGGNDVESALDRVDELRRVPDNALDPADDLRLPGLRAAAQAGSTVAALELARLLRIARALPEAAHWYLVASRAGAAGAEVELGEMLYDLGEALSRHVIHRFLPSAEAAYERAYAAAFADPADVALIERVGRLYLEMDDDFRAGAWLRRAARLGHGDAAWWAGRRSEASGDPQEAERMWALAAYHGVAQAGWLAGRSMVRRGAHTEAEPLLRLAWAGREEQEQLHEAAYWMGLSLRGQGRLDEAAGWLRTAVAVHAHVRKGYEALSEPAPFDPEEGLADVLSAMDRDNDATPVT
ncbi:hypothetical protein [Spirillospora sp. CA-294931]|uniref:tetratricopeptide repeat protein n=1 Tax=Spirillospora sp. CA-294931 TaxID=3240042 RepID=UPI003D9178A5